MLKFSACIILIFCSITFGAQYPADLPKCKPGDHECLPGVITEIIKKAHKGIPGLNLQPIDPLHVDELNILQGKDSPVNIDLKFKNVTFSGFSKLQIIKVVGFEKNPSTSKFEFHANIPGSVILEGPYSIKGQILVLPIFGNGNSKIEMENADVTIKFTGKVEKKDGKEYLQVADLQLDVKPKKMIINFSNLFNGDKLLGDTTNTFMNESWQDIYKEIKPSLIQALAKIASGIINSVFSEISYDNAFLE